MKEKESLYIRIRRKIDRLFHFVLRVHEVGSENEPKNGGLIVCANHTSFVDVIVLGLAIKRQLRYVAKAELFKIPLLSGLIRALGAIPLDRGGKDVGAIKQTIELLKSGEAVGLFPQGHRYRRVAPELSQVKYGVGMTAYRSGADILPVFIKSKGYKMRLFGRKDVIIGKVIKNSELGIETGNTAEYRRAAELIFSRILELEKGAENEN